MYNNQWKKWQKAQESEASMRAYSEEASLRNLIKYSLNDIIVNTDNVIAKWKDLQFESMSQLKAIEWYLDVRWGIKIHLKSIKPLWFEKLDGCGPILSKERKAAKEKELKPELMFKLTMKHRALLIPEIERNIEYSEGDTKRDWQELQEYLLNAQEIKVDGILKP